MVEEAPGTKWGCGPKLDDDGRLVTFMIPQPGEYMLKQWQVRSRVGRKLGRPEEGSIGSIRRCDLGDNLVVGGDDEPIYGFSCDCAGDAIRDKRMTAQEPDVLPR